MKRLLAPLAIVAVASLIGLLLFEMALRLLGFTSPTWYRPDAELGWTLRPGVAGWHTKEGRAFVEASSAGWRDIEHTVDKPTDVYRIAVLGDSYSEAMQVDRDEAFWALLPERLIACGFARGKRIEVLNFGVSGYGTAQEYLVLESQAMRYRPDLVLLQFTNGNDVRNNSQALEEDKLRPFYLLEADNTLRLDRSFASEADYLRRSSTGHETLRKLSDRSRIVQLVQTVRSQPLMPQAKAAPAGVEQGLEPLVLAPPVDPLWEEAWQITEKLLAKTAAYARQHGAQFMLVTVPYAIQVHPDPLVRVALQDKLGVPDLFYPDSRIAGISRRNAFRAVLLAPEMQGLAETHQTYFHGFPDIGMGRGHWNAEGHRAAAEIIGRRLCSAGG